MLFGRRTKSEQAKALEKLKSSNTLGDLKAICANFIPDNLLAPTAKGAHSFQETPPYTLASEQNNIPNHPDTLDN